MKLGVSSYSFYALTSTGKMNMFDVIAKSKEMGFDYIEIAGFDTPEGETKEGYAKKLKAECDRVGIKIGNYTIGADFINGSDGNLEAEIERLKGEVNIAHILGATGMRHDATGGFKAEMKGAKGFDQALPILVKGCRAVTEYAAQYGIRTMIENHGFFSQDSERVEKVYNGVNHENFGLLVDIGNFLCADESPIHAVGRVAPYAAHVHIKDFHIKAGTEANPGDGWFSSRGGNYLRGAIVGHGNVPVIQCLKIIKNSGYDATMSIEFEGLEDCITGIAIGQQNLKNYLNLI